MELTEAHDLLTIAAAYDGRKPSEAADRAWASALTHLGAGFEDARQAIIEHYAETTDWIMPAHVGRRADAIKRNRDHETYLAARRARHTAPALPPGERHDRRDDLIELIGRLRLIDPETGQPRPLRDDPTALHALRERYRAADDGHERWSLVGDPAMRRRQRNSVSPEAADAAEKASRVKAAQLSRDYRAGKRTDDR